MIPRPCLKCGALAQGSYCPSHEPPKKNYPKASSTQRGYPYRWRRFSQRVRKAQPWCTQCGSTDDLTTDHSPGAWERHNKGLPIRYTDVQVLCRSCNSKAGKARPTTIKEYINDK